jgi:hypothetical protein
MFNALKFVFDKTFLFAHLNRLLLFVLLGNSMPMRQVELRFSSHSSTQMFCGFCGKSNFFVLFNLLYSFLFQFLTTNPFSSSSMELHFVCVCVRQYQYVCLAQIGFVINLRHQNQLMSSENFI